MKQRSFVILFFVLLLTLGFGGTKTYAAEHKKAVAAALKNINVIETPDSSTAVTDKDKIEISGYFLSKYKIKSAKVYFDDKYAGSASTGIKRADVLKKYPKYSSKLKPGYTFAIDTLNVDKGSHKLKVVILTSDNKTTTAKKTFKYDGQAAKLKIETPAANFSTGDYSIKLSGYAMSTSNIKEADIIVDGIFWGSAQLGIDRADIADKYPDYSEAAKSGFEYELDISQLKKGTHTIEVQAIDGDGKNYSQQTVIVYNKPEPKLVVSSPSDSSNINTSTMEVTGWSVGVSGIQKVEVYLDGEFKGAAATGTATTETSDILTQYKGAANAGYNCQFDITTLPIGKHTLEVRSTDLDGIVTTKDVNFNMNGAVEYTSYPNTLDYYVDAQNQKNNYVGNTTVKATRDQLYAAMNPDNYLDDPQGRFMFLKLNYVSGIKASDLDAALQGMGALAGKGSVFLEAAQKYNVNPIYLVAHAMHETSKGTSKLANGVEVSSVGEQTVDTKTVYNMYGIGATDGQATKAGSERAYKEGWFSVEDAIIGGAQFIAKDYIQSSTYKQYTLYKMRWNFEVTWHEYATDINWAYSQTAYIKAIVDKMESPVLVFEVPEFSK